MNTFVLDAEVVHIPSSVVDLDTFRRWAQSDEFPEVGRICYLHGEVWVDMSKEQVFSHNQVKNEFNLVVGGLVKAGRLGRYFPDGRLLSNADADVSSTPDGTFVSRQSSWTPAASVWPLTSSVTRPEAMLPVANSRAGSSPRCSESRFD